jgi:hypothetical protein
MTKIGIILKSLASISIPLITDKAHKKPANLGEDIGKDNRIIGKSNWSQKDFRENIKGRQSVDDHDQDYADSGIS